MNERHTAREGGRLAGLAARRLVWPLLVVVVVAAVLFIGVFPARTWLNQRSSTAAAASRVAELTEQNAQMQSRIDALDTDAEIERIAREQYGLAKPGEEVYHILPTPKDPVPVPDAWPFNRLEAELDR